MGSAFHPGQGPGGMGPPLRVQGCSSSPTKEPPRWSLHSEPRAAQGVCVEPGRRPQAPGVLTWAHGPALSPLGRIAVQLRGCGVSYRTCGGPASVCSVIRRPCCLRPLN